MMNSNQRRRVQLSIADLITMVTQNRGREILPLSPTKRVYIEPEELMRKHDKRVALEFEIWKQKNLY